MSKPISEEMSSKRAHLKLESDTMRKLKALMALKDTSRDDVVSEAINDLYKKNIELLAIQEGIVEKSPRIEIKQEFFDQERYSTVFDDMCKEIGVRDGSATAIVLEIRKFHTK